MASVFWTPEDIDNYVCNVINDVDWRTGIVDSGLRSDPPAVFNLSYAFSSRHLPSLSAAGISGNRGGNTDEAAVLLDLLGH